MGGMMGLLFAGKSQGWWDLELNIESADFLKPVSKAGRIHLDIWGGHQQWAVLFGRILVNLGGMPEIKSTITGEISEVHPGTLAERIARSKATPLLSDILELWLKEDFKGDEIDRTDWLRWIKIHQPMAMMDMLETFVAEGLKGLRYGSTGVIGGGVITYDLPRWPELDKYYNYVKNHPGVTPEDAKAWKKGFRSISENEAKLFVRGHIDTLTSEEAGILVKELMIKHKLTPKDVPGYEGQFQTTEWPPGSGNRSTSESVETAAGVTP
jgi:hypothetical protein